MLVDSLQLAIGQINILLLLFEVIAVATLMTKKQELFVAVEKPTSQTDVCLLSSRETNHMPI